MNDTSFSVPRHPLGVKPAGNIYSSATTLRGPFLQLPDELLVQILEHLDPKSLITLGSTCKAFFAFSRLDELWKTLFIESSKCPLKWRGTWYATYAEIPEPETVKIAVNDLASDVLYRPFLCAHTPLEPYTTNIPISNRIVRLANLTAEEFSRKWADTPFILTEPVKEWPVYRNWSRNDLLEKYKDVVFRAEAVDWPLSTYIDYMTNTSDESPVYLFDHAFAEKMNIEAGPDGEYWSPDCFGEDLFTVLGKQRPDHRWLIIGPERSGSTFHKDPNATSAWNAVISGSKYWIMFPSSPKYPPPPGVYVSEDQSEVTSPLSIAEWLMGFHAEARSTPGCIEGICKEGEILHVPSGWWHLVVNLSPSIALTQNFIPEAHLGNALDFLRNKKDQVSGFRDDVSDPYGLFKERLEHSCPDLLHKVLEAKENLPTIKKRKWTELVNGAIEETATDTKKLNESNITNGEKSGFSFGFGGDDDEAEVP